MRGLAGNAVIDGPLLYLAAAAALASVVQTTIGFGAGLITITLGGLVLPLPEVLALVVPMLVVQGGLVVSRHLDQVAWRLVLLRVLPWMGTGMALAIPLGAQAGLWLKPVFGILVLGVAGVELLGPARRAPPGPRLASAALLGAGLVHGLFATGGPLLVWALGTQPLEKGVFRTTLISVFLSLNLVLCAVFVARGTLDGAAATRAALLAIPVALGNLVGERVHDRVDERRFRIAVWVGLAVAALALVVG